MALEVRFQKTEDVEDASLSFAVIMARMDLAWIFCQHRQRNTWEIPGGHREHGESIEQAARRELYEETGATAFTLAPICAYCVENEGRQSFGMLFFAYVRELGTLPEMEIAQITLLDDLPKHLTYPLIQPLLFEKGIAFWEEHQATLDWIGLLPINE